MNRTDTKSEINHREKAIVCEYRLGRYLIILTKLKIKKIYKKY